MSLTLTANNQSGDPGDSVAYTGTLLNNTGSTFYIDADSFTFSGSADVTLDDNPFLNNAPLSLAPGELSSVFEVFHIDLSPSAAVGDSFVGIFTAIGGTDPTASDMTSTANFQINVAAPSSVTPEGSSVGMLLGGALPFGVIPMVGFLLPASHAQQSARPMSPLTSRETYLPERSLLAQTANMVSQGQFAQAASLLKALPVSKNTRIFVDLTAVPKVHRLAYRNAVEHSMQLWNGILGKETTFGLTDQQDTAEITPIFETRVGLMVSGDNLLIPLKSNGLSEKRLELRTYGEPAVEVTRIVANSPYAAAKLGSAPSQDDKGHRYTVALAIQAYAPIGRSTLVLTAFTTSPPLSWF